MAKKTDKQYTNPAIQLHTILTTLVGASKLRDPLILPYEINKTKPFLNRRLALESLQGGAL